MKRSESETSDQNWIKNDWIDRRQKKRVILVLATIPIMLILVIGTPFLLLSLDPESDIGTILLISLAEMLAWVFGAVWYGNAPYNKDIKSGIQFEVIPADGMFLWDRDRFRFFSQGSQKPAFSLEPGISETLLPGYPYSITYVADPHVLLSWMPRGGKKPEVLETIRAGISKTIGFGPPDLERNARGGLTFRQAGIALRRVILRAMAGVLSTASIMIFLVVAVAGALVQLLLLQPVFCIALACLLTIILLVLAIKFSKIILEIWMILKEHFWTPISKVPLLVIDLLLGKVGYCDGSGQDHYPRKYPYRLDPNELNIKHHFFSFQVGAMEFNLSRREARVLFSGIDYRVYYLPFSQELVGITPLDVDIPRKASRPHRCSPPCWVPK